MTRFSHRLYACAVLALLGCEAEAAEEPPFTIEELKNPETCMGCHPSHYREWKASMHAYASEDPVFVAMNALGQEETNGELGDFCVKCHAPMAVEEGLTSDGMNLDELPDHMKGVTCYFCHNVVDVQGDHNAEITLAHDTVMRGSIVDPVAPKAHGVAFSRFHDHRNPESSRFCGGCHDIVTPAGVHLERTFAEYKESLFGSDESDSFLSCNSCHMDARQDVAAKDPDTDVGLRYVHSHLWPGVDVAISEWPDREAYEDRVDCALANSVQYTQAATGAEWDLTNLTVRLESNAGHRFPSGAAQDRRIWLEIVGYDSEGVERCSLGKVPDDQAAATWVDEPSCDPSSSFWLFRDQIFDKDGNETHMFWRADPSSADAGVLSQALPFAMPFTGDPIPHYVENTFQVSNTVHNVSRITLRVRSRPMDFDVLEELIDEGLLDESIKDEIRTVTIPGTEAEIRLSDTGLPGDLVLTGDDNLNCRDFECAFHPDAPGCR